MKRFKRREFHLLHLKKLKKYAFQLIVNFASIKKYDLFFANGGDQNNNSIPEAGVCNKLNIGLIDGLGDKIQSSSWLLKK